MRSDLFHANLVKIAELNSNPDDEAVYGVNHMSDWTEAEFTKLLGQNAGNDQTAEVRDFVNFAPSKDWRDSLDVTPIKDQGSCGSCWAFSAAETIESTYAIWNNHNLNTLSEQELLDCSRYLGTNGCKGGWHFKGF